MSGTLRRATAGAPSLEKLCPGLTPGSSGGGGGFPSVRPRRLRQSAALRRLVAEVRVDPADLVLPLFVKDGLSEPRPISSLPGVVQHSRDSLRRVVAEAVETGIGGVMLFGVPLERDHCGTTDKVLNTAIADVIAEVGNDTVVMSDLCLDEFTDHGHCGVLAADGSVDNDATLLRYAEMAVAQADAGAHVLGLSGMMDGQVGVVRAALDAAGHTNAVILAYAAKYASGFYGPFREAVESQLKGDRKTYQQDPANAAEALREVALDIAEGADIIMVKPALPYLDVLRQVADSVDVPVAAYQVSGEYAMVEAAAANGWIDREQVILETLVGARRAGADFVLTYWALEAAGLLATR
jgi:porphobilinogen synthase